MASVRAITTKSSLRRGSAVAANPVITHACRPCHITKPTGRPDDPVPRKQRWVKVLPPQWHTLKKASRGKACQPHPLPPTETMLQGELFKLAAG
jgi:hypothetical protein